MEKTIFKNKIYYKTLLVIISLLICWNIYAILITQKYYTLISIAVLSTVFILIITKNKHAKLGLNIWTALLIIGPILLITGKSIKVLLGDDIPNVSSEVIISMVTLICGLFIYHFNKTTVKASLLEESENKKVVVNE